MASVPFKVKALFEYSSPHDDDLNFAVGQIITVTAIEDDDWYFGDYHLEDGPKKEGIFPRNFVEKYEPVAPPRPLRTHAKKVSEAAAPAPAPEPEPEPPITNYEPDPEPEPETEKELKSSVQDEPASAPSLPLSPVQPASPPAQVSNLASPSAPKQHSPGSVRPQAPLTTLSTSKPSESAAATPPLPSATKPGPPPSRGPPPPVAGKPISSAFRDRIAAFNKPAEGPIAPFKPSNLSSGPTGFIKKPFVAPPPSRNAYIPTHQPSTQAQKVYRREEDADVKEQEADKKEITEKVDLVRATSHEIEENADKPMSLKERMAMLQKQQMEAAQRHAEAVARKEKPKRPAKKRSDSHENEAASDIASPSLERQDTQEYAPRASMDEPAQKQYLTRRKPSKGPAEHIQDGNEADMSGAGDTTEGPDELTEREDGDEKQKHLPHPVPPPPPRQADENPEHQDQEVREQGIEDEVNEDEDEDIDPEVRRKEELRARMAKLAGPGMGMGGMFGIPVPMIGGSAPGPPKKKKTHREEMHQEFDQKAVSSTNVPAIPPMMALPGISRSQPTSPYEETKENETSKPAAVPVPPVSSELEIEDEETTGTTSQDNPILSPPSSHVEPTSPPPVPSGLPAPPPIPEDSRPPPPPPPQALQPESEGSESDDEMSERPRQEEPRHESIHRAPLSPLISGPPPPIPTSPRSPDTNRQSYIGEESSPSSIGASRRASRPPPPIPGLAPMLPPGVNRPPPPPPPSTFSPSTTEAPAISPRRPMKPEGDDEVTEYEGDYDTDIASSVPHKDALKAHSREFSHDDNTSLRSPVSEAPPSMPPPPVPSQPPPPAHPSTDMPRDAPPPPPKEVVPQYDDDYEPYNYSAPTKGTAISGLAQTSSPRTEHQSYISEQTPTLAFSPVERRGPPPAPSSGRSSHRQSLDIHRASGQPKRSMEASRPSMSLDSGYCANDIDLAQYTNWWQQSNTLPPSLQTRKDIYYEIEEQISASGSQHIVTRDIYVLYQDYSQTVITVSYNANNITDVEIDQRHEAPPRSPRQDELESQHEQFGKIIADSIREKKDHVVGDGTPQGLIMDLLKPLKSVLLPVGTRAYGALVYQNLANASTQLHDQIRPGDIISIRNAKFQGKHGPMHAKYSMEVGKPDHVGIVAEWDGTKKKVRAWEQGRESKKCKIESFKLDDLRSGEVKIWRVMPRSWVNWDDRN